jgi:hypothetical protein
MNPESEDLDRLTQGIAVRLHQEQPIFRVIREPTHSPLSSPSASSPLGERRTPASSLRKICSAILNKYLPYENEEICLKNLANELRTERRRVYDIVNILEAFDILTKKAKNLYLWKGLEEFRRKLVSLGWGVAWTANPKLFNFENKPVKSKKKMLTYMSLKVLRFLGQQTQPISFGEIVRLCLCGESQKDYASEKRASTTRRLYDIVNVLNALGLISKVYDDQHKKFYRWNGPMGMKALGASAKPLPRMVLPDSPERSIEGVSESIGRSMIVPAISSENNPQPPNQTPMPRLKGFQPCKDFTAFPVTEIKRFLSFSDGEGSCRGESGNGFP